EGAGLVEEDGVSIGNAAVDRPRSAVGAGDALLAGFLAAGAKGGTALAEALAWGAAAVSLPGSRMPGPDDLQRHRVRIQVMPVELDHHNWQPMLAKLGQPNYQPPDEVWVAEA